MKIDKIAYCGLEQHFKEQVERDNASINRIWAAASSPQISDWSRRKTRIPNRSPRHVIWATCCMTWTIATPPTLHRCFFEPVW